MKLSRSHFPGVCGWSKQYRTARWGAYPALPNTLVKEIIRNVNIKIKTYQTDDVRSCPIQHKRRRDMVDRHLILGSSHKPRSLLRSTEGHLAWRKDHLQVHMGDNINNRWTVRAETRLPFISIVNLMECVIVYVGRSTLREMRTNKLNFCGFSFGVHSFSWTPVK